MRELMLRLDGFVRRWRRVILGAWIIAFLAALPLAAKQSERLTSGGFSVPGSESLAVQESLRDDFPGTQRSNLAAVLVPERGASRRDVRAALGRVQRAAGQVARVSAPRRAALRTDRPAVVPLRLDVTTDGESVDIARKLRERLEPGETVGGVRTHLVGYGALWSGMSELSKEDLAKAETIGFPVVALILLVVFGSLAAAALPLALGVVAVALTGAAVYLLSLKMEMSVFVTNMASMVGIGVAVDYSLFIVARFREELRGGALPEEARSRAMATSGLAVLFSGATVIASLAALFLIPVGALRSMAIGAIVVVAVAMLASATLLPILLRLVGRRLARKESAKAGKAADRGFWRRWTDVVMRRPVVSTVLSGGLLLLLAVPVLSLETNIGALRQMPPGFETREGAAAAAQVAEPGASSPIRVIVSPGERRAVRRVTRRLEAHPAVARVERPRPSRDGDGTLVGAIARTDAESPRTTALVKELRRELPAAAGAGTRVEVGGSTATLEDLRALLDRSMWKIVAFVVIASYLVLLVLLRSVLLPLKAVVMNLLSVGAAFGVLVAVFQWGWLDGLLGFDSPGAIDWLTPPLVLAVVFGLSMDYEVFLLSRIRERYESSGDTAAAVAGGLAASARIITSAAIIMVAVFAAFVGTGVSSIQQIGLGTAVAIAIDATLVRLVLMPATMRLFGRWNWWLPRRLDRALAFANELPLHAPRSDPRRSAG